MKSKYNVLDLFAGCGGLSKGFELAGFNIVAANEFWEPAQKTYIKNHPNTKFFPGDITKPETKSLIFEFFKKKKCDVIIGGPPCQAYSIAGLRDPDDPRGRLFEDYVEIVKKLKPKIFVMENVKGLLTMNHDRDDLSEIQRKEFQNYKNLESERAELLLLRKRSKNNPLKFKFGQFEELKLDKINNQMKTMAIKTIKFREPVTEKIIRCFKKIGYKLKFRVLNAADYGIPQKRQRVIVIGTKLDIPIVYPSPTHESKININANGKGLLPWVTVKEAIHDLKEMPNNISFNHIITAHDREFLNKIKNTKIGSSVFGGYADAFFRNRPDEPSRTVKENHGGVLVHYEKNRVMTPRELARLQSFRDDFIFEGSKSTILKQIGNAVPVGLAKAIGESVKKMLDNTQNI